MTNKVPEEWGNNYKSGWQPGLEANEATGQGEITPLVRTQTLEIV